MQLTNFMTVLALALTATALPAVEKAEAELVARNGGGGGGGGQSCDGHQQTVCCTGGLLNLGCLLNVLGTGCIGGSTYCCSNTNYNSASLLPLDVLNCVALNL